MRKQLQLLREEMRSRHIDAYLIPTTDFHGSEYIHEHFKFRQYVSGFTGSAGTLLVTASEAKLWTDGRYFLQAENQLKGSGIDLIKSGQVGVPTIEQYLEENLLADQVLAFDGRVMDFTFGACLSEKFSVLSDVDLADEIWQNRPKIFPSKIYPLPLSVTGESCAAKLDRLFRYLKAEEADFHLITDLTDIAWLFNLRGSDIAHTPVFFAFTLVCGKTVNLYVLGDIPQNIDGEAGAHLPACVRILPYEQIYDDLSALPCGTMLLNTEKVSYALVKSLPADVKMLSAENPTTLMKALKNPVEISSTKKAHLRDGAAVTEFIYWLKQNTGASGCFISARSSDSAGSANNIEITEITAADYLALCRKKAGSRDLSFDTICGYNENGAIVHYCAEPTSCKTLQEGGFLLVDSGGQYEDGTTDITRTIALGEPSEEMKLHYTAVLKSHIALATAKFPAGTTGAELDAIARKPLRELGLDFNHGTGHGVGHLLSVHEGPQSISPRAGYCPICPGMITSNEPGVYLENRYGIRLENEILCIESATDIYAFETLTLCPFERDAILSNLLTTDERRWLNEYHRRVHAALSPLLDENAVKWLAEVTREI